MQSIRNFKNKVKNMINKKYQTRGLKKTKSGNHYLPTNHINNDIEQLHKDAKEQIRRDGMKWDGVMSKEMRKAAKKIEKKTKKGGKRRKTKRTRRTKKNKKKTKRKSRSKSHKKRRRKTKKKRR